MTAASLVAATPWWVHVPAVLVLVAGAVIRMSRFFTSDTLGQWLVVDPATKWAYGYEFRKRAQLREHLEELLTEEVEDEESRNWHNNVEHFQDRITTEEPLTWQAQLVSGLSCPFCVGFHLAWIIPALTLAVFATPALAGSWISTAWLIVLLALTLNYVLAHLSSRLDFHSEE